MTEEPEPRDDTDSHGRSAHHWLGPVEAPLHGEHWTASPGPRPGVDPLAVAVQGEYRRSALMRARLLDHVGRAVTAWDAQWRAEENRVSPLLPRGLRYTDAQLATLVVSEVAVLTGLPQSAAARLVLEARAVTTHPAILTALRTGRLDEHRVAALVQATKDLSQKAAAVVVRRVTVADLAQLRRTGHGVIGPAVWDLVTPQGWRQRLRRIVAKVRTEHDEDDPVLVNPTVQVRTDDDATASLVFTGTLDDVLRLKRTLEDLADTLPTGLTGPDGQVLTADEREARALLQLCDGRTNGSPVVSTRRREVGLVLHADTLLGHGPAARDPGEVRGLGTPVPVGAHQIRQTAQTALAAGASTVLLLTDDRGHLTRLLRVGTAPPGGWTRDTLLAAGRSALATAAPLHTDRHDPTVAIDEHVRAAQPVSVAPGVGAATHSGSSRADLDHRIPHPRGPTDVHNLQPLARTPHRHKTRGTWHCHTPDDDPHAITWATRTGATWTHRPEPLPGYGIGEGHAEARRGA